MEVPNKQAFTVMEAFNNHWLSRYPRPRRIRFDNGSEFKYVFREMCTNYGLKHKPTTTYNPRSNGIVKRVHQVLGDALRTYELQERDLPDYDPFGSFLSAAAWAIRSTLHTTLQATPGQLVFGRDMLLDIPFKANWGVIRARKQNLINKGVLRANRTRYAHTYKINDKVLYTIPGVTPKMSSPRAGPYRVTQVYTNGITVRIRRGAITETVNIRNITPYFDRPLDRR